MSYGELNHGSPLLFAVETMEPRLLEQFPGFKRPVEWFVGNRRDLTCTTLPRRHRRRSGRQPSDGVDGPSGQAVAAERGVRGKAVVLRRNLSLSATVYGTS